MITSTNNDRVKQVVAYVQKSKARKDGDVFVIEGMKMLREAPVLQADYLIRQLRKIKRSVGDTVLKKFQMMS